MELCCLQIYTTIRNNIFHFCTTFFPDYYTHFILGESIIETYAKENPVVEQSVASAKTTLPEAERHLKIVLKENVKVKNSQVTIMLSVIYDYTNRAVSF